MPSTYVLLVLFVAFLHVYVTQQQCIPLDLLSQGWVRDPENVETEIGDEVRFSCKYINPVTKVSEEVATVWIHYTLMSRRDGITTSIPEKNYTFSASTQGDLVITYVTHYHAGMYGCIFASCSRSTTSKNATLFILHKPSITLEADVFVNTSDPLTIRGSIFGHPAPSFALYHVNSSSGLHHPVNSSRFNITYIYTSFVVYIHLSHPRLTDEGTYNLEAVNNRGKDAVNFTININDIDECKSSTLASECVENSSCFNTLGSFDCPCDEGFEGDGKRECRSKLSTDPPVISGGSTTQLVSLGSSVVLTCTVADDPTGMVVWRKNGGKLPSTVTVDGNVLTISEMKASDVGEYTCLAPNGRATSFALVINKYATSNNVWLIYVGTMTTIVIAVAGVLLSIAVHAIIVKRWIKKYVSTNTMDKKASTTDP